MPFEFVTPHNLEDALELHADGARWFAGGTDVVPKFKAGLVAPARLVNLKRIQELRGIDFAGDGLHLGALATLAEIAESERVRGVFPALAQACELSASPQIRNVATIGGNLCQDTRCPYYRGEFHCYLKGGDDCFMLEGENRSAAVIGYRDCVHAHPSDPANALVALDAEIRLRGREGKRTIRAEDFFRAPQGGDRRLNTLEPDEVLCEIYVPQVGDDSRSIFLKAMDRATWTFALASAALRLDFQDGKIRAARVVVGGVAPVPWREVRVEQALEGDRLNEDLATRASAEALRDASPLAHNGYKLRLARALVKRALIELNQAHTGGA